LFRYVLTSVKGDCVGTANANVSEIAQPNLEAGNTSTPLASIYSSPKALQILQLLSRSCVRKTVYTSGMRYSELAKKLNVSRQALSSHLRKLYESGFVETSRDFYVTEQGLRAMGQWRELALVTVRVASRRRLQVIEQIEGFGEGDVLRVVGDVDLVLIIEQDQLERTLEILSQVEGVLDTRTLLIIPSEDKTRQAETAVSNFGHASSAWK